MDGKNFEGRGRAGTSYVIIQAAKDKDSGDVVLLLQLNLLGSRWKGGFGEASDSPPLVYRGSGIVLAVAPPPSGYCRKVQCSHDSG